MDFDDLQDAIRDWWGEGGRECGSDSCEHLARQLGLDLAAAGLRVVLVDVAEDDENGATIRFQP